MLERFFYSQEKEPLSFVGQPDIILTVEERADGSRVTVPMDLNTINDPLSPLSYSDFSINQCLKNGVSYKALNINSDLRLGFDSEIDAFNQHLEEIADQLYETSKN